MQAGGPGSGEDGESAAARARVEGGSYASAVRWACHGREGRVHEGGALERGACSALRS